MKYYDETKIDKYVDALNSKFMALVGPEIEKHGFDTNVKIWQSWLVLQAGSISKKKDPDFRLAIVSRWYIKYSPLYHVMTD